jgi:hypothetical protein
MDREAMRVDCGQLDPGTVIRPEPGEWHPPYARAPRRGGARGLARRGNAIYQRAALTIGTRLAFADA